MADNVEITAGSGTAVATDDVASVHYQVVKIAHGADGAVDGLVDNASPLPVVQTGTLNVGTVTAVTAITDALPAGDNNIGNVDVVTLPALPAGNNNIGDVDIASIAAGDNNIGNVDIVTMPNVVIGSGTLTAVTSITNALPAGTNAIGKLAANSGVDIGDVDVTSVPADPFGANADAASATGSISAKLRGMATALGVTALDLGSGTGGSRTLRTFLDTGCNPVLGAGSAAIGKLAANSGVDIGDVDVTSVPTDPFGANADAASATGSISAKLRAMATAWGTTALDLGSGTGGSRTLRTYPDTAAIHKVSSGFISISVDITRENNTTAYAADQTWADDNGPTTGGFTLTNAARTSGGSGLITDACFTTSADPATKLQAEMWLFNQAVTAIADAGAFAVSDAEIKTCVGVIPFTMADSGNNGFYHAQNLSIGFTCVGTANLRFLVRVKNAYTPVSNEVLTCTLKIMYID